MIRMIPAKPTVWGAIWRVIGGVFVLLVVFDVFYVIIDGLMPGFGAVFSTAVGQIIALMGNLIGVALLVGGYFLPTIVARKRGHHDAGAIIALNIMLGWTVLGWIGAFVWSLTALRTS